jgi:hypothetical protein
MTLNVYNVPWRKVEDEGYSSGTEFITYPSNKLEGPSEEDMGVAPTLPSI